MHPSLVVKPSGAAKLELKAGDKTLEKCTRRTRPASPAATRSPTRRTNRSSSSRKRSADLLARSIELYLATLKLVTKLTLSFMLVACVLLTVNGSTGSGRRYRASTTISSSTIDGSPTRSPTPRACSPIRRARRRAMRSCARPTPVTAQSRFAGCAIPASRRRSHTSRARSSRGSGPTRSSRTSPTTTPARAASTLGPFARRRRGGDRGVRTEQDRGEPRAAGPRGLCEIGAHARDRVRRDGRSCSARGSSDAPRATSLRSRGGSGAATSTRRLPSRAATSWGRAREMNTMADKLRGATTRAADETAARIATIEQLRHADRLMTIGKLATGIAHELGAPINVIELRASLIANQEVTGPAVVDSGRAIVDAADRMTRTIGQLLAFARRQTLDRAPTDITRLAKQTVELVEPLMMKSRVIVEVDAKDGMRASVDELQVQQALTNLLVNAQQSMPNGGRVALSIVQVDAANANPSKKPSGPHVRIRVGDDGEGIAPENLPRLFEPYLHDQGGRPGNGPRPQHRGQHRSRSRRADHGRERARQRDAVRRLSAGGVEAVQPRPPRRRRPQPLRTLVVGLDGARVPGRSASAPRRALDRLRVEDFDVVVTDLNMPGMGGLELCERIVANRPDIPVVVITAFGSLETRDRAPSAPAPTTSSPSPFELEALALTLERAVQHRALRDGGQAPAREAVAARGGSASIIGAQPGRCGASTTSSTASPRPTRRCSSPARAAPARSWSRARSTTRAARADGPFVAINCAAMPEALLESELFGHARAPSPTRRRAAHGPVRAGQRRHALPRRDRRACRSALQPKLLRALQERTVRPVGGDAEVAVRRAHRRGHQPRPRDAPSRSAASARTSSTASTSCASRCRRCARAATTCCSSRSTSSTRFADARRQEGDAGSRRRRPRSCSPTPGRATCASCRTASSARSR